MGTASLQKNKDNQGATSGDACVFCSSFPQQMIAQMCTHLMIKYGSFKPVKSKVHISFLLCWQTDLHTVAKPTARLPIVREEFQQDCRRQNLLPRQDKCSISLLGLLGDQVWLLIEP